MFICIPNECDVIAIAFKFEFVIIIHLLFLYKIALSYSLQNYLSITIFLVDRLSRRVQYAQVRQRKVFEG